MTFEITEETVTTTIFKVDGKEFISKESAEEYIKKAGARLNYVFFAVQEAPDLTEGRGFQRKTVYAVKKTKHPSVGLAEQALIQYLFDSNGQKALADAYGTPSVLWNIRERQMFDTIEDMETWVSKELAPLPAYANPCFNKPNQTVMYVSEFGKQLFDDDTERG